jgi:hypothetical protein
MTVYDLPACPRVTLQEGKDRSKKNDKGQRPLYKGRFLEAGTGPSTSLGCKKAKQEI